MKQKSIAKGSDKFIPFPKIQKILVKDQQHLARYFLPLASVHLSLAQKSLNEWYHILLPIEPWDGAFGEGSPDQHTYYCGTNRIGFSDEAGRYRFLADESIFRLATAPNDQDISDHYRDALSSFRKLRSIYLKQGFIVDKYAEPRSSGLYYKRDSVPFAYIGGVPRLGNFRAEGFPYESDATEDAPYFGPDYPLTEDGRRFLFIGKVNGHHFRSGGPQLLCFYDPPTKIAFIALQFS